MTDKPGISGFPNLLLLRLNALCHTHLRKEQQRSHPGTNLLSCTICYSSLYRNLPIKNAPRHSLLHPGTNNHQELSAVPPALNSLPFLCKPGNPENPCRAAPLIHLTRATCCPNSRETFSCSRLCSDSLLQSVPFASSR